MLPVEAVFFIFHMQKAFHTDLIKMHFKNVLSLKDSCDVFFGESSGQQTVHIDKRL